MKPLVSVITCTGHRKEAFELCKRYLEATTYDGPIQWIIVHDEDGDREVVSSRSNIEVEVYQGPRVWTPGYNTQRGNFELALSKVKGDYIFSYEDDEFFSPEFIPQMLKILKTVDAAGIANNRYYHVGLPGWKEMGNYRHSSLCSTAFKKELMPLMELATNSGELYFDIHFWNQLRAKGIPFSLQANSSLCVGMKGMPGRTGIGVGHRSIGFSIDSGLSKLQEWLGEEGVKTYSPFIKKIPVAAEPPKPITSQLKRPVVQVPPRPLAKPLQTKTPVVRNQDPTQPPLISIDNKPEPTPKIRDLGVVPEMKQHIQPKANIATATASQKAAMAMLPQGPGLNPAGAELGQSTSKVGMGEILQGDRFK